MLTKGRVKTVMQVANLFVCIAFLMQIGTVSALAATSATVALSVTVVVPDTTPPGAITDLTATPGALEGEIRLTWTAPHEDGTYGSKVSGYIVKYATFSVVALSGDTTAWWNHPQTIIGLEIPQSQVRKPGETETNSVQGLVPGITYYFAIKSVDDAGNWSEIDTLAPTANQAKAIPPEPERKYFSISGVVMDENSRPIRGVTLSLTGGESKSITTGYDGKYSFSLEWKKQYTVSAYKSGWEFTPPYYSTTTLSADITDWDFVGRSKEKVIIKLPKPPADWFDSKFPEFSLPADGDIKITPSNYENRRWVNPDKGEKAYVIFKGAKPGNFTLRVFNLVGELIHEETKYFANGYGYFEWPEESVPSGTYIMHIQGPGINKFRKVVIMR
ncbi:MAG: carboxypeptidase regulatory-like domain-containing protein [Elusimicrobiota bacterium]|nr:carboxypeptidase regulatory-like domain-containing protein [Elusimicrobiota bacterium]